MAAAGARFAELGVLLGHLWQRSLQLRVAVSTITLSLIVITILGVVLTDQITSRMLDTKINAAVEEMARARNAVHGQLSNIQESNTQTRLVEARNSLSSGGSPQTGVAGSYDLALVMVDGSQQELTAGPIQDVPVELRNFVRRGQVSRQFTTISDSSWYQGQALIIGSPSVDVPTLEIYLIFPLASEARSLSLMRGTMMIGGIVLLVLLAAITALVTRQVVLPIRSAARIAGRFADGRLKERMLVRGEDDMARLAQAFNEMAESLSNQITQLEEFGNLQRRFTSDVSHELRTPLTTVRMAADLIHGSSDDLDPALARSAELLVNELDRFEGLLNDLLEISRHDAGVAELQVESLDVRMCARAAISTVRHLAKDAGVEVVIDMPDEPLVAEVDPRRVERVLRNLLANAIDHSEGKPVLIRMRGDLDANAVSVVVRDQGVGLRPGEEKLVFNRFWRSDPSRMRRSGGTGLGLSISVEDANLHEGRLEAWGEVGVGASFRLTLPLVRGKKLGTSPLPLEPVRKQAAARQAELEIVPSTSEPEPEAAPGETVSFPSGGTAVFASGNGSTVVAPSPVAGSDTAGPDDESTPPGADPARRPGDVPL
nr:MtrAB system histidine kinase MtrB [Nocardia brasiliensis]